MKLNEFMNTYKGFDWKNGKVIIVKNNRPLIINGVYRITLKRHLEDRLLAFTHDSNTIVITLGE